MKSKWHNENVRDNVVTLQGEGHNDGSVWRKWDLHIHTPASALNNNFNVGWDTYVQELFRTAIKRDIAVIGLTDYYSIDGYKKVTTEYLANDEKLNELFEPEEIASVKRILVLPNIEFRSDKFVNDGSVNFHILFSEQVSIQDIEERFLSEIMFSYEGDPGNQNQQRKLTRTNLLDLGNQLQQEHQQFKDKDPLVIGVSNAVVNDEEVSKLLANKKNVFGGRYLFTIVADEHLSDIDWNSRAHNTRKLLLQKSQMLFASNAKTIQWALGKPPYSDGEEEFVSEFKSLKPCIHGSDAHDLIHIAHPCVKRGIPGHTCATAKDCELRYCWIKADCTFEGLKQLLYEPEDRVAIQETDPTPLKSSQSIRSFGIDATTVGAELAFPTTNIELNNSLVAVTGGKGSGKTALVDMIANMYENRVACDDGNSFVRRVSEERSKEDFNTNITLSDDTPLQKEITDDRFLDGSSVVYVAQGELEKHVERPEHLENYIRELIFDSNQVRDSEALFDYKKIEDEVASIGDEIDLVNRDIASLVRQTDQKVEQDLIRNKSKLEIELKDTREKAKKLSAGLSKENIDKAEAQQAELAKLRSRKSLLSELESKLKDARHFVATDLSTFNLAVEKINQYCAQLNLTPEVSIIEYSGAEPIATLSEVVRNELRSVVTAIEKFQEELAEKDRAIKDHATLLDRISELNSSIESLDKEIQKLKVERDLKSTKEEQRTELFLALITERLNQREKYLSIIQSFSASKSDILNDLEFVADLVFDRDRFHSAVSDLVDQRKIETRDQRDSAIVFFSDAMSEFAKNPTKESAEKIARELVTELIKVVERNSKKSETVSEELIYEHIFRDYLGVVPSVKYKHVPLTKLSMGQKATVLLKIYLAQGEAPIVIDSHDDHLDNEFIMDELVTALRQAKQQRQIIIVSNNGNVVVNSDAEQIVIANRSDNGEISYESGSLENPTLRPRLLKVLEGGKDAFSKRQKKYRLSE